MKTKPEPLTRREIAHRMAAIGALLVIAGIPVLACGRGGRVLAPAQGVTFIWPCGSSTIPIDSGESDSPSAATDAAKELTETPETPGSAPVFAFRPGVDTGAGRGADGAHYSLVICGEEVAKLTPTPTHDEGPALLWVSQALIDRIDAEALAGAYGRTSPSK